MTTPDHDNNLTAAIHTIETQTLSLPEAALASGLSLTTMRLYTSPSRNVIEPVRIPSGGERPSVRVRRDDLDDYMRTRARKTKEEAG